jgi:putative MATE family efflux protein
MKDLTKGSITSHILSMAPPIFGGMILIMLCQLIDLYFVSDLGDAAIAGVAAAGNAGFLVNALMQVLGVGSVALIAHAVGRKDRADANLVFNQSLALAGACAFATWIFGSALARTYMASVSADKAIIEAGTTYLLCFIPALAMQFALVVMGSALRGTGIVRPTMLVQALAVMLNIALAPVLIAGWGTGYALGVAGAGLASSVAVLFGVMVLWFYFRSREHYVRIDQKQWRPQAAQCIRILSIGWPAGGEFGIMFVYMGVIYYALSDFGAAAQAGFGIGSRVLGLMHAPVLSIAFAAAPIAGQNYGAGNGGRVRETFQKAAFIGTVVMIAFTIFVQFKPGLLLGGFSIDAETLAVGQMFLQMVSLNLVAQGLIFACSSMFQGLGNTKPVILSSGVRLITYAAPVIWLSGRPDFHIEQVWYLSIATTTLQAALSFWLLKIEFRKSAFAIKKPSPASAAPPP